MSKALRRSPFYRKCTFWLVIAFNIASSVSKIEKGSPPSLNLGGDPFYYFNLQVFGISAVSEAVAFAAKNKSSTVLCARLSMITFKERIGVKKWAAIGICIVGWFSLYKKGFIYLSCIIQDAR